ncbi:MAG: A/G-specific adenine glycosylase [Clostridia bacterium]|nr:A/G-specific adenine glycosylase [Clostridia bacterium]
MKNMHPLTKAILSWHSLTARDLPWRGETDPYRIYVSEIMLQQTRTETVKKYYGRFLLAFPDPASLAQAPQELVNKLWEGLGYYTRARNLVRAMQVVCEAYGGRLPESREELKKLPGCGEYVSAAVSSIAFGKRELALDGNGVRVLSRITGETGVSDLPAARARLRAFGESILPLEGTGEFNQALMGMGNLVCLPKKALCENCPAAPWCLGHQNGNALCLPVKAPKPEKKQERRLIALVTDGKKVLVRKREEKLLNGLYEFVNLPWPDGRSWREVLAENGITHETAHPAADFDHVFTHLIWHMRGFTVKTDLVEREGFQAVNREQLLALPMPSAMEPFRRLALEEI